MSRIRILSVYLPLTFLTGLTFSLPAVPLNSPSLLLTQDSSAVELPQASNLPSPTSNTFAISNADLSQRLHHFGPFFDPIELKSFFLEVSSEIQHHIDQISVDSASAERHYNYKSDDGFVLEIWSSSVSPEGYVSSGEQRNVINGLSLYMRQGRRSRAVRFQVIQNLGDTKAIMHAGSIRRDAALPTIRAKRNLPPSPLVPTSSVTGFLNASILRLPAADNFPIPDTDYSLYLGNLGIQLRPWDLELLLIAVSTAIREEITAHGRLARLPSTEYSKKFAGLWFWIQSMPWATVNLAWAELAIIVNGLWLYIVEGGHDREAFIDVINHVTGNQVAFGWIGKPP